MYKILFYGWTTGFQKVRFNHLLREYTGLSLAEAKGIVDTLLAAEQVRVTVPNMEDALALLEKASTLYVKGKIED